MESEDLFFFLENEDFLWKMASYFGKQGHFLKNEDMFCK